MRFGLIGYNKYITLLQTQELKILIIMISVDNTVLKEYILKLYPINRGMSSLHFTNDLPYFFDLT